MNLIIDVGNTLVKLAVFRKFEVFEKITTEYHEFSNSVTALLNKYPIIKQGIISSVGRLKPKDIDHLKTQIELLVLNSETNLPFENLYETPQTLGVDRIALVSASVLKHPNDNVLIIDCGTCITYDFINTKNQYLGGAISPGLRLRYQSLHNLTANLPLLETKVPKSIVGNSTNESIHSGVVNGVLKEIDSVIDEYQQENSELTVILTGGDSKFLSKQLKNGIFANSNFLLEGLNYILEFNSNE